MTLTSQVRTTLPKPPHGAACNSCGACCMTALCPLAVAILGEQPGPCPALEPQPDGRHLCGMYAHPARYMPVRAAIVGEGILRVAFGIIAGQGDDSTGCDTHMVGEPYNRPYVEALDRRSNNPIRRARVAEAGRAIGPEIMREAARVALAPKRSRTQET